MPIIVDPGLIPGTGLDLRAVWLNNAADPADFQSFEYAGDKLSPTTTGLVEVRQLVSRRRLIATGVVQALGGGVVETYESLGVTFPLCTREQVAWLKAHVGVLLCVRDHVGSKFYAAYASAPREITAGAAFLDRISVSLTLDEVTFSEAAV